MSFEHFVTAFEVKEIDANGAVSGYGSVFSTVDQGGDVVMPGAFKAACEKMQSGGRKPKMLWAHDPAQPIGVWETMREDGNGLFLQGRILSKVSKGAEVLELLRAKAIDGLSVGYKVLKEEYQKTARGMIRELHELDLWETSLVTFPMHPDATVTDVKQLGSPRDVERLLKSAGVPSSFAKLVALHGYEGAAERLKQQPCDEAKRAAQQERDALLLKLKTLKGVFNGKG